MNGWDPHTFSTEDKGSRLSHPAPMTVTQSEIVQCHPGVSFTFEKKTPPFLPTPAPIETAYGIDQNSGITLAADGTK